MATLSGGTIGTGGNYPDIASWWAACPADLVAADIIWQGRLLNQEFTGAGSILTISGKTTDATRYVELTTAPGSSFKDHANKATNPLRYNATVGAAIRMTGDYATAILVQQPYTRISNIQFAGSSQTVNAGTVLQVSGSATNCDINGCIIEGYSNDRPFRMGGAANVIRNSLVIQRRPSAAAYILELTNGSQAYNCTLVSTGAKLSAGLVTLYAAGVLKNCYIGNVTAARDSGTTPTITTSYTDGTGAGFSSAPFSTATFVNITDGTHDFRLAAGSPLIDVGTTDTTYSATGILGTARPQGAAYDIGAWEYTVVATPVSFTGPVPTRNGNVGSAASFSNAGFFAGTATPFTYSSVGTALPAGLTLSSSTGIISGTPTVQGTTSGIIIRATDTNNATADTNAYSIVIAASNAAPTFPGSIANITGTAGTAITQVNVSGQFSDSDALTYSASPAGTAWPSGLTINATTGVISGTIASATTVTGLRVRATDTASQTVDSNTFSVTINPATGSFKTAPLYNNTNSTPWAIGTAVTWQWHQASIGTAGTITYGSTTVASDGTATATNVPISSGFLLLAGPNGSVYYQAGTVS